MKNINLDKSNKLLSMSLNISMILSLLLPILLYVYFNNGADSYLKTDNFYKITTEKGKESAKRIPPSLRPITNLETTKEWLKLSLINLMTYDAANYNTEKRYNMVKEIFAEGAFDSFWASDKARIEEDISNGYLRSAAIISYRPILLGQATNSKGEKMWKFFLEIQIKQESRFESYPRYYKKYAQIVIKEIDPKDNFKGIGIVRINIK